MLNDDIVNKSNYKIRQDVNGEYTSVQLIPRLEWIVVAIM